MVHRSAHVQELNLLNLKANMMFQIRPLNKFGILAIVQGDRSPGNTSRKSPPKENTFSVYLPLTHTHVPVGDCGLT